MIQLQSKARKGAALTVIGLMFAAVTVMFASAAMAQDLACPAGGRGGSGGDGGRSSGGNGGLAFTVPAFGSTAAPASAAGGNGGLARGGTGGRGGSGTLPICNQNTNGTVGAAHGGGGGGGGGGGAAAYGHGGGLARTGTRTYAELGVAGVAFLLGGGFLFFGQPLRRIRSIK